jgi:hypothetical protein
MALQPFVGPWPLLQFHNLFYTDGRTPWTSDQPVARPLPTHRTTQTQNKRTWTSMPWVGFEPTILASKRAKRAHALDRAATVIGPSIYLPIHNSQAYSLLTLQKNSICSRKELLRDTHIKITPAASEMRNNTLKEPMNFPFRIRIYS